MYWSWIKLKFYERKLYVFNNVPNTVIDSFNFCQSFDFNEHAMFPFSSISTLMDFLILWSPFLSPSFYCNLKFILLNYTYIKVLWIYVIWIRLQTKSHTLFNVKTGEIPYFNFFLSFFFVYFTLKQILFHNDDEKWRNSMMNDFKRILSVGCSI